MEKRQLASKKLVLEVKHGLLWKQTLSYPVQNRQTRSRRDATWGSGYISTADCAGLWSPTWTNPVLLWLLAQMKPHVCVKASLTMLSLRPAGNRPARVTLAYVHFCNAAGSHPRWLCTFWCRTRGPIAECDSESVRRTRRQDRPTWFLCSGGKKTIRKLEYREKVAGCVLFTVVCVSVTSHILVLNPSCVGSSGACECLDLKMTCLTSLYE